MGEKVYIGPKANPKIYIETTNDASKSLLLLNSTINCGTPGANMEDAKGLGRTSVSIS